MKLQRQKTYNFSMIYIIYLFILNATRTTLDVATEICILITGNLSVLNVGVSF